MLSALSHAQMIDYYYCGACGHVWTVETANGKIVQHVTSKKPGSS